MERLFVYGSLKKGCSNAARLTGARYLGVAWTAPGFELVRYVDDYPALTHVRAPSPGDSLRRVRGELYEVDEALLRALDDFEEVPELYRRESIELESGEEVFAFVIPSDEAERWERLPDMHWEEGRERPSRA